MAAFNPDYPPKSIRSSLLKRLPLQIQPRSAQGGESRRGQLRGRLPPSQSIDLQTTKGAQSSAELACGRAVRGTGDELRRDGNPGI